MKTKTKKLAAPIHCRPVVKTVSVGTTSKMTDEQILCFKPTVDSTHSFARYDCIKAEYLGVAIRIVATNENAARLVLHRQFNVPNAALHLPITFLSWKGEFGFIFTLNNEHITFGLDAETPFVHFNAQCSAFLYQVDNSTSKISVPRRD